MIAAIYTRYSTARQSENSTQYQIDACLNYCTKNNISVRQIYSDEETTGTNINREAFTRLMQDAKQKIFDCIVIYDITRGSRDVVDWFNFRKELDNIGVKLYSVTEQLGDLLDPDNFLRELLTAGIGQHAVLQTRRKSIEGVHNKAKQGIFLGGVPPLGYDIENGKYIINPEESKVINLIFAYYADGKSYNAILAAVCGFKGKRGKPLGKNSLNSILKNERYIGVYSWNKRYIKKMGKWAGGKENPNAVFLNDIIPPIIDINIWGLVQKRMKNNKKNAANTAKYEYHLSGKIICENCGGSYTGRTNKTKSGGLYRHYVCGNKYRTRTCAAKTLNADDLESVVKESIKKWLKNIDYEKTADQIISLSETTDKNKERTAELIELNDEINNLTKAAAKVPIEEIYSLLTEKKKRKMEIERDIIFAHNKSTDRETIIKQLKASTENPKDEELIKKFTKIIYAHPDGTVTIEMGVNKIGCGGGI